MAAARGLQRFGDGTLSELDKLLSQCVRELKARGVVQVVGEQLVITPARSAEAAEVELRPSKLDEAPTIQTRAGSPKRVAKQRTEEMIAAPARRAEDEDILDLTPELELHSPSKPDAIPSNQMRMGVGEPTRGWKIANPAGTAEDKDVLELTAELELREEVDDILELTAELELREEVDGILELTAELELREIEGTVDLRAEPDFRSYLRSPKLDEAPAQREQVASDPEPGAEPTREEIIAAMRRFISDD
jgi:hypothetical protein